jgi:hypothetical protein
LKFPTVTDWAGTAGEFTVQQVVCVLGPYENAQFSAVRMLVQCRRDHLEPEMPATLDTPQGRSSHRHFGTDLNQNFT